MNKVFLFLILIFIFSCKSKQTEIKPETKMLTEAVYASGNLISENDYKLVANSEGYLLKSWVKEGDKIDANQLLFQLKSSTRNTQMQSATEMLEKTLPITDANSPLMADLKNKIELAKAKFNLDSLNFNRYQHLYQQNATTKSQLEAFELKYKSSKIELSGLQQQLSQTKLSSAITLQQSKNQLNLAKDAIENTQLKSVSAGTVYEIYKNLGDWILPNQPVALIGNGKLIARLSIDETDLNKVKLGQKVLITMDAYADKIFKATVTKIYPALNKIEQSIRVDAEFEEQLPADFYGLNLEANIVVNENKQVLAIPKRVLLKGDSVWIQSSEGKKKVKINKGIEDKEFVEVTSGITSSTILIEQK